MVNIKNSFESPKKVRWIRNPKKSKKTKKVWKSRKSRVHGFPLGTGTVIVLFVIEIVAFSISTSSNVPMLTLTDLQEYDNCSS